MTHLNVLACAVCFGAPGSTETKAVVAGVILLGSLIALVLSGIIAFILRFRANARQYHSDSVSSSSL